MPVTTLTSHEEYKAAINGDKPAVIDFWAEWCGPCKVIKPIFKKFSDMDQFQGVAFYDLDTEELEESSEEAGVSAMPTFIAFHKGEKIGVEKGAFPNKIQDLIKSAAAKASGAPSATSEAPAPTPSTTSEAPAPAAVPAPRTETAGSVTEPAVPPAAPAKA